MGITYFPVHREKIKRMLNVVAVEILHLYCCKRESKQEHVDFTRTIKIWVNI